MCEKHVRFIKAVVSRFLCVFYYYCAQTEEAARRLDFGSLPSTKPAKTQKSPKPPKTKKLSKSPGKKTAKRVKRKKVPLSAAKQKDPDVVHPLDELTRSKISGGSIRHTPRLKPVPSRADADKSDDRYFLGDMRQESVLRGVKHASDGYFSFDVLANK